MRETTKIVQLSALSHHVFVAAQDILSLLPRKNTSELFKNIDMKHESYLFVTEKYIN